MRTECTGNGTRWSLVPQFRPGAIAFGGMQMRRIFTFAMIPGITFMALISVMPGAQAGTVAGTVAGRMKPV